MRGRLACSLHDSCPRLPPHHRIARPRFCCLIVQIGVQGPVMDSDESLLERGVILLTIRYTGCRFASLLRSKEMASRNSW